MKRKEIVKAALLHYREAGFKKLAELRHLKRKREASQVELEIDEINQMLRELQE